MRVLLIHPQAEGRGGAEKLLDYYLQSAVGGPTHFTLALADGASWQADLPGEWPRVFIENNDHFSIAGMKRQCLALRRRHCLQPFDLVHAWAARDWELGALMGCVLRRPSIGTLHDHPSARYISGKRQRLMRWIARAGLERVVCVSQAVHEACVDAGYPRSRLVVVRNGIPITDLPPRGAVSPMFRMGYLGTITEGKGLRDLFAMLAVLAETMPEGWTLSMAGEPQREEGRTLLHALTEQYGKTRWWPQVIWHGWVNEPSAFVAQCDLLVCPSSDFESFGLVLCEAAIAGVPALATRKGGYAEIIEDGVTGWLYDPRRVEPAAHTAAQLARDPGRVRRAGEAARQRVRDQFSAERMAREYAILYGRLLRPDEPTVAGGADSDQPS